MLVIVISKSSNRLYLIPLESDSRIQAVLLLTLFGRPTVRSLRVQHLTNSAATWCLPLLGHKSRKFILCLTNYTFKLCLAGFKHFPAYLSGSLRSAACWQTNSLVRFPRHAPSLRKISHSSTNSVEISIISRSRNRL